MVNDPTTLPPPAPYDPQSLEMIRVKVCDMGNACWVDHHFTNGEPSLLLILLALFLILITRSAS